MILQLLTQVDIRWTGFTIIQCSVCYLGIRFLIWQLRQILRHVRTDVPYTIMIVQLSEYRYCACMLGKHKSWSFRRLVKPLQERIIFATVLFSLTMNCININCNLWDSRWSGIRNCLLEFPLRLLKVLDTILVSLDNSLFLHLQNFVFLQSTFTNRLIQGIQYDLVVMTFLPQKIHLSEQGHIHSFRNTTSDSVIMRNKLMDTHRYCAFLLALFALENKWTSGIGALECDTLLFMTHSETLLLCIQAAHINLEFFS